MSLAVTPRGKFLYEPDGPVLSDYFWDRSALMVIQGPIGSGTSSASVHKIWNIACDQAPDDDKVRCSCWIVTRDCLSNQTEILTEDGWRLFRDLEEGQKVAQLKDGNTEFVLPMGYHAAPLKGDLMSFEGAGVGFSVTPGHRMHVSQRRTRQKIW